MSTQIDTPLYVVGKIRNQSTWIIVHLTRNQKWWHQRLVSNDAKYSQFNCDYPAYSFDDIIDWLKRDFTKFFIHENLNEASIKLSTLQQK